MKRRVILATMIAINVGLVEKSLREPEWFCLLVLGICAMLGYSFFAFTWSTVWPALKEAEELYEQVVSGSGTIRKTFRERPIWSALLVGTTLVLVIGVVVFLAAPHDPFSGQPNTTAMTAAIVMLVDAVILAFVVHKA